MDALSLYRESRRKQIESVSKLKSNPLKLDADHPSKIDDRSGNQLRARIDLVAGKVELFN